MAKIKKLIKFLIFISGVVSLISCEVEVPVREIINAKLSIDRAYDVKAEKYSDKNLNLAVQLLYNSHEFLKDDKIKDALDSAVKSKEKSDAAINESLPLLAKDSLSEAVKIYNEAETQNAEIFAQEDFNTTNNSIKDSEKLNNDKQYWESHLKSKNAIATGKAASEKSIAAIPGLKSKIQQLEDQYNTLNSQELSKIAEKDLDSAKQDIGKGKVELEEKKLKNISKYLVDIEKNLVLAKEKIDDALNIEKKIAEEKIKIDFLIKEMAALKTGKGKDYAANELNKADNAIGEANELLTKRQPKESGTKTAEADSIIKIAKDKIRQGIAREKLDSVSKLYEQIKIKDPDGKLKDNLDKANSIILSSSKSFDDKQYEESVLKSDEAELLLNSSSIALVKIEDEKKGVKNELLSGKDKEVDKDATKNKDLVEEKPVYYVVKYRQQNTDCLWRIAETVYKNSRLWPLIYKANRDQIKDPDLIFPGQRFLIPNLQKRSDINKEINDIRNSLLQGKSDKSKK